MGDVTDGASDRGGRGGNGAGGTEGKRSGSLGAVGVSINGIDMSIPPFVRKYFSYLLTTGTLVFGNW